MVAHPPTYTYSAHCTNTFVTVCSQETCDDGHRLFHELHTVHYFFQVNFTKTPSWVKIFRKPFSSTSSFVCVTSVKSILSLKQLQISGALPLHWAREVWNVFHWTLCSSVIFSSNSKSLSVRMYDSPLSDCRFSRNLIGQHAAQSLRLCHQLSVCRVLDSLNVWLHVDRIIETHWVYRDLIWFDLFFYQRLKKMCFPNYPRTYGHGLSFVWDAQYKWNEKLT